jgi:hypothetical protein
MKKSEKVMLKLKKLSFLKQVLIYDILLFFMSFFQNSLNALKIYSFCFQ